jgi:hypothetical protein
VKNLSTFCPCPGTLSAANCKGDGLDHLAEAISRQPSTQAVAREMLAGFNQIYSENQEQKGE